jgi:ketosteroid isomerase-like protein
MSGRANLTEVGRADTDLAANKAVVRRFFELLGAGRFDEAFALQDPAGPVHLPSPRQDLAAGDWHVVYRRLMATMFPSGVTYTLGPVTAEDDRVSVVAAGHGTMANGADYDNHYQWLAVVRDGRIVELYESLDTLYAERTLHAAGWVGRRASEA